MIKKIQLPDELLVSLLIFLIPFQGYFSFYKSLSVSVAQILSGILFFRLIWLKRGNIRELFSLKMDWAVIVFIFALFVSIWVSSEKINSVKYFIKWSSFIALYYLGKGSIKDISSANRYLKVLALTAFTVAMIGFAEYAAGPDRVISFLQVNPVAPVVMEPDTLKTKLIPGNNNWTAWSGNNKVIRMFGPFDGSIEFAAFLGLILPFFLFIRSENKKVFYLVAAAGIICCAAVFMNFTRSAYLALCAVAAVYAILNRQKAIYSTVIKTALAIAVMAVLVIILSPSVRSTLNSRIIHPPRAAEVPRRILWGNGIRIFMAKPVLGMGLANYATGLKVFCPENAPMLPAHNEFIQLAAESGIAGLAAYMGVLFFGLKYSFELFRRSTDLFMSNIGLGFIGMWVFYIIMTIYDSTLFGDKFSMIFWLMAGFNAAIYGIYSNGRQINA